MKQKTKLFNLVLAALFAAIITVFTAWLFHIPIKVGSNTAYIHFGDAFLFLGASLLSTPYACLAAAVGGGLADLFCGAAVWAPFTIFIKAMIAFCFSSKGEKIVSKRNSFALFMALLITVIGYYIAEALIYGNWLAPAFSVLGNVIQIVGSAIIYVFVSIALEKIKIKSRLKLN